MSGGFRGSNGPGTTDGTGPAGVIARIRRDQRGSRSSGQTSRRIVEFTIPTDLAAGSATTYGLALNPPHEDDAYLVSAFVLASGRGSALSAVAAPISQTEGVVNISVRAVSAVPANSILRVQTIHP